MVLKRSVLAALVAFFSLGSAQGSGHVYHQTSNHDLAQTCGCVSDNPTYIPPVRENQAPLSFELHSTCLVNQPNCPIDPTPTIHADVTYTVNPKTSSNKNGFLKGCTYKAWLPGHFLHDQEIHASHNKFYVGGKTR